ncbi:MAG: hypothetical protein HN884_17395 [Rhodospirillaceae bacterium]|nr:hypothetical protein [Rhodospirillaceae bacterium]
MVQGTYETFVEAGRQHYGGSLKGKWILTGGLGGMGGGSSSGGGMGGFMTGRATANLLTRSTGILATCFFITSMTLAIMADQGREKGSILDQNAAPANQNHIPMTPTVPTVPSAPSK